MTTREIYFKALVMTDMSKGSIGYAFTDKNNVIQLGADICLEFRTDEEAINKAIKQMKKVEQLDGFMFWNTSPEGGQFFKENWPTISESICKNI